MNEHAYKCADIYIHTYICIFHRYSGETFNNDLFARIRINVHTHIQICSHTYMNEHMPCVHIYIPQILWGDIRQ